MLVSHATVYDIPYCERRMRVEHRPCYSEKTGQSQEARINKHIIKKIKEGDIVDPSTSLTHAQEVLRMEIVPNFGLVLISLTTMAKLQLQGRFHNGKGQTTDRQSCRVPKKLNAG